ncbi:MAG: toprim domain-containing protein [Deltaproteobacteria bacterium]|nr:toprim domain-containing protein [Deltaproteobacteria bacterium]
MARIPEAQLERLKAEVAVERLAEARGIVLARRGADLVGLCPFHEDHEPSLVITPAKNLWHCRGACQAGGSVVDWVMRAEGVSFRHAVELLQADYLLSVSPMGAVKRSTVQKLPTAIARGAEDARLLLQVIAYYHETLKESSEALAYLEKRGLASGEAITRFQLGFANRTLGYRLPAKTRTEGAAIRGQLQRLGILRPSGHEHFNGSLVIPVVSASGEVTEVYGRKITDALREGTPLHLYLPGPHAGVWNVEALGASKEIILCESLIDALSFWCAGYRNVTASYGVEGFTPDHLAAFQAHGTERVLIAYDRDAAGEAAAEKLAAKLLAEGIDCYRVQFPKGMDANAYALAVRPATKSLGVVIRAAQWLGKGQPRPVTTEATSEAAPATLPLPELAAANTDEDRAPEEEAALPLAASEAAAKEEAAEAVLPAAVIPDAPRPQIPAAVSEQEIVVVLGDRRYRIRGLAKNPSYELLKVNLLVSRPSFDRAGETVHVDTFDLYAQRPRAAFVRQAAVELGVKEEVVKADLGKILLKLEALQAERTAAAQAAKEKTVTLDDEETRAALDLLKAPDLLDRTSRDFTRCGVVGESTNKLVGYLAAISRKLERPLAVTIQSTSAAGKSALMDAVLAFVPEEDRVKYSAMTGQSLFYLGETDLQHKVLALVEEEGSSRAAYALKLLQSEGELTIASTGKDPVTGELKTREYRVQGPVMILFTTTAIDLDEELLNRCLVLSVDEGREQTRAIHAIQRSRRTLAGLVARAERQAIERLHQNAQRLLQPLAVVNPYGRHLTFVDDRTRTRRDHEKYLTLIDAIALLHQHQRPIQSVMHQGQPIRYVEVTRADLETANRLAHEVLGRTLDELPPKTRELLRRLVAWVAEQCAALDLGRADFRFSRRAVREVTRWSDTALKVHLGRLAEMEYLLVHRGGRGQSFEYELLYQGEGEAGAPFLMGLIDVAKLDYDAEWSGQNEARSGVGPALVSPRSGGGPGAGISRSAKSREELDATGSSEPENALLQGSSSNVSHRSRTTALAARTAD